MPGGQGKCEKIKFTFLFRQADAMRAVSGENQAYVIVKKLRYT